MLLQECPGALRSDLRSVYGLSLNDLYRGDLGVLEASDYARHLPPGSAVWRELGGPNAWTDEVHMLSVVEHNTRILWWLKTKDGSKGGDPPKMLEPPTSKLAEAVQESRVQAVLRRQKSRRRAS